MEDFTPGDIFVSIMTKNAPSAYAWINGGTDYPDISGIMRFYDTPFAGVVVDVEIYGLPDMADTANMTDMGGNTNGNMSNNMNGNMSAKNSGKGNSNKAVSGGEASNFYGMHIHEFGDCTPPFDKTGGHYNPYNTEHPEHAGDMPPLMSNNGYAWMSFFDGRFTIEEIIGKSVIIHHMRDNFTTQPSGDSGEKIACGVIYAQK